MITKLGSISPRSMRSSRVGVALDVALAGLQRDRAVHPRSDGELVHKSAVDTDDRYRASVAAGDDGLAQRRSAIRLQPDGLLDPVIATAPGGRRVCLHADGIDASVRAAPAVMSLSIAMTSSSS